MNMETNTVAVMGVHSDTVYELAHRVQAEYREMPGLSVTLPQAQKLLDADQHTCAAVFSLLIGRGVLKRTARGCYVRA
jgi:hypothetical protein